MADAYQVVLGMVAVSIIVLVPIGFVCDHVEVLYDVDIEHKHQAAELGIRLERPRMLNDDPGLIEAVANSALKPRTRRSPSV